MKDRSHEVLPRALLDEIATAATVRSFPKHAVIVTESDSTDNIYVMLAGKARVYVSDEKGREVVLNQLGPGEYFGEITIDGGPRSASVMALEECRCALIRRTELTAFIERSPGFALHVVKKLAHRVRSLTENMRSLALLDVYGRVARLLLELAEEKDGQLVISEPLTHKEIAARVGASREMISRIFSDLNDGGYLRKEEGRLVIARKPPPRW
ncbi:MAG TPA: Crp/Fnr family transcriptional regulator [Burkholderiales bacterium]|nr:Crp/Fnr family transcriptional regulator [Burkholderiales bacterium]